jgi:hypothetical protein
MRDMFTPLELYRAQIEGALRYSGGTHTFEDVQESVQAGAMQVFARPRSIIITEIVVFPQRKVLNMFLGGGEMEEIEDMFPEIEAWAASMGCAAVTATGRHGWARSFMTRKRGYESVATVYSKELAHV